MDGGLIVIFCSTYPPEGGGASARIYNLARLLDGAGYRVQVVCGMPNYPTGRIFGAYRRRLVADEVRDGIAVKRVWLSPSNKVSALSRGWSMLSFVLSLKVFAFRAIRGMNPRLIIVSSPPLPMAAAVMRHFSKKGFKVMLNVSDIWPLSAKALGALDGNNLYERLEAIAAKMYAAATAITAQSAETLAHIRAHCVPMPPAMLYRNLPSPGISAMPPCNATMAPGLTIIYPGMLGHAQGLLSLCRAIDFKRLGATLIIYGDGPERQAIAAIIAAQPEKGIQLREPMLPESMAMLLETADAVLIPLAAPIEGALPSKLFSAIQAGAPILFSGAGEGAEIVTKHNLGWTAAPGDYAMIAQQITMLSSMPPQELRAWKARIRDTATTHFSRATQDAAFLKFLAGVLNAP